MHLKMCGTKPHGRGSDETQGSDGVYYAPRNANRNSEDYNSFSNSGNNYSSEYKR